MKTHSSVPKKTGRVSQETLAIIMAGGSGSRLKDLTRWHAKPAVPFGGKYRTIDFPLSNCINSNIRKIFILTQYKSHSLNRHIQRGWNFLRAELGEFVELIPAQQRIKEMWYRGTADSVFQNLDIIEELDPAFVLILAGDHIYKMNYKEMIRAHMNTGAEMTVGCIEVPLEDAKEFGVMSVNNNDQIMEFNEKPDNPQPSPDNPEVALVSMGIYIFNREFLSRTLNEDELKEGSSHDFGKDIIPALIHRYPVSAFRFRNEEREEGGYWRDVGTVDAYYEANMELLAVTPPLNLYDQRWPIWTYQEQLPPGKFVFDDDGRRGYAVDSMVSAGCIVSGSAVRRSILSNNVRVHSYCILSDCVILPDVDIGRNCRLSKVIIDKNCVIPPGTVIGEDLEQDSQRYHVSPAGVVLVSAEMLKVALNEV
ncbi:MAG: glucose-1-phosphate adenylyltransferase [Pseudomonadales bacterium]|nr:glucose-1-phosphate adenylyltransferase [Pseudomonadales bacterium]